MTVSLCLRKRFPCVRKSQWPLVLFCYWYATRAFGCFFHNIHLLFNMCFCLFIDVYFVFKPMLSCLIAVQALQSQAEKTANQEETRHLDSKGPEPFEEPCHTQSQSNEVAPEVPLSGISMGSRQLNPAREVDEIQKGDRKEEIEPHFGCKEAQL